MRWLGGQPGAGVISLAGLTAFGAQDLRSVAVFCSMLSVQR
jgi:hypothetical protein